MTEPKHATLFAALSAFQSERPDLEKDQTAKIPGKEGKQGYTYGYASLASVEKAVLPILGRHGLAWTCLLVAGERGPVVVGRLLHESGDSLESVWPITSGTPQAMGSLISYAKRYLLMAMTGVSAHDDDDDGAAAQAAYEPRSRQAEPEQRERPAPVAGTRIGAADECAREIFEVPLERIGEVWERIEVGGYMGNKPSAHAAKGILDYLAPAEIPKDSVPGKHLSMATATLTNIVCFRLILAAWTAEQFKGQNVADSAVKAYADLTRRQPNFAKMKLYDGQSIGDYVTLIAGLLNRERNSDPEQNDSPPWVASADVPYGKHDVAPDISGYGGDTREPARQVEPWDPPNGVAYDSADAEDNDRPAVLEGT